MKTTITKPSPAAIRGQIQCQRMRRFLIWKNEHINNHIEITHDQFFRILNKF